MLLRKSTSIELKKFLSGKMSDVKAFKVPEKTADMIKEDLAASKIPYVDDAGRYADFHCLRHSTGSLLAKVGVHPKAAQSIMRHSNINLTMLRYTYVFRGQESEAVAKLPDLSLPSREKQQAKATGNDGKNLSENLSFFAGQKQISTNPNEQQNRIGGIENTFFERGRWGPTPQSSDLTY